MASTCCGVAVTPAATRASSPGMTLTIVNATRLSSATVSAALASRRQKYPTIPVTAAYALTRTVRRLIGLAFGSATMPVTPDV